MHESEVITRVRELWGLGPAGSRIQDSVARGINSLLVTGRCVREDECLNLPEAPVRIRNREQARSAGLRKPELLPRVEVRAAILAILHASYGAGERELSVAVARAFGFRSTSAGLRALVSEQLQHLRQSGDLIEADGLLRLAVTA